MQRPRSKRPRRGEDRRPTAPAPRRPAPPRRPRARRSLATAVCALACALAAAAPARAAVRYEPGRGLHLLDDRLLIGGYLAIKGSVLDGEPHRLVLDDLSAFVTYRFTPDLELFTEFEVEDAVFIDKDGPDVGRNVASLERLYLQYEAPRQLRIRAGKLLTPIGIWNPIHAAPLVWTTSRPAATDEFFDTGLTGIQIDKGFLLGDLDAQATIFGQFTNQLDRTGARHPIHRGGGGRVQLGDLGRWQTAVSYLGFEDEKETQWENFFGADARLDTRSWEVTSELAVLMPTHGAVTWSVYLQAVYDLGWGFYPVVRYEHAKLAEGEGDPFIFGLAYKPRPNVVLKAEGVLGRSGLDLGGNGFLTSFAVLF